MIFTKEKLTIENFGPIKSVELELKRFNILIGEQATGKSTVAKVLAVCRYFSFINEFNYFEKEGSAFSWGLISWGLDGFVKKDTIISYSCQHYSLEAVAVKTSFDPWVNKSNDNEESFDVEIKLVPKSKEFKTLLSELKKINANLNKYSLEDTPVTFFQNKVAKVMENPFYLPAERGLQSIFSLGKSPNFSDSLFNQFAKIDSINKNFKKATEIEPLNLFYKNERGSSLFKSKKHGFINLSNAATGYQSAIPIVLTIKYYSDIRKKKKTFIVEEPEQNLFPKAQYELVKFFTEDINSMHTLLITTHSPYILTSLNNLMYAYQTGQDSETESNKIIEKKYWLDPNEVSSYMLLPDGTCENILNRSDDGTILIKAEKIDAISRQLNRDFDKLIDLEISK
ncbi:MAG: AAA family ATPase [Chitinophagaceae bacterium]|nr:AAA family ATPase [Chitinophagaceae bacterium]